MILDSDTMTCAQRFRSILDGEIPDRIPIFLMGMPEYGDFFQEFISRQDEDFDEWSENDNNIQITPLGDQTIPYYFGQEMVIKGVDIDAKVEKLVDDNGNFIDEPDPKMRVKKVVNYWGRLEGETILKTGHKYGWYLGGYLQKKDQIINWFDKYGWPHEHKVNHFDENLYNEFMANWSDKFFPAISIGGAGLYEKTWFMMGQARFSYYARKDPEFLMRIINSIKEMHLNILKEVSRAKPELIWVSDDLGQKGRSLLSPKMYEKFFQNARTELNDAIHEIGAKVIMHSCGNITELLPLLIESHLDGWQSLEPASAIDHESVKKKYGDKLIFVGGIDTTRELCFGTADSVRKHVKHQIEILGKNGGYICGPAHDFLNQKMDLVQTMRDAIYEFGSY